MRVWFKDKTEARTYQRKFKQTYGYRPSLFIRSSNEMFIVKPRGLKKLT